MTMAQFVMFDAAKVLDMLHVIAAWVPWLYFTGCFLKK